MGFVSVEVVLVEGVSVGGASVFRSVSGWAVDVESRARQFSLKQLRCRTGCPTLHCHCSPLPNAQA